MMEEWIISCWNSKISHAWTVEHLMVEQWNRDGGTAGGGKVQQKWWNSGTSYGGTGNRDEK